MRFVRAEGRAKGRLKVQRVIGVGWWERRERVRRGGRGLVVKEWVSGVMVMVMWILAGGLVVVGVVVDMVVGVLCRWVVLQLG